MQLLEGQYNGDLLQALQLLFPNYTWDGKRIQDGNAVASNQQLLAEFLEEVGSRLGVKKKEDWYNITKSEFENKVTILNRIL